MERPAQVVGGAGRFALHLDDRQEELTGLIVAFHEAVSVPLPRCLEAGEQQRRQDGGDRDEDEPVKMQERGL